MRLRFCVVVFVALSTLSLAIAVEAQPTPAPVLYDTTGTAWAYAAHFQVPWTRVDSLIKLEAYRVAWRARAIQMGCFLDYQLQIHHTGNEYNVVRTTTYPSFRFIGPGAERSGCANEAWQSTVSDANLRRAIQDGFNWIVAESPHYDVIYWIPYPARR